MNTKIIAGLKKGTILQNPENGTRPLTNRIKQSLFDLITNFLEGANVLDLYAGGGNFGIEALSRGASEATFVDISINSINCIERNLEKCKFLTNAKLVQAKVQDFVRESQNKYDIIMLDPPFDNIVLKHIEDSSKILKTDGILIFRHPREFKTPKKLGDLKQTYQKKYGKSIISFYQNA